MTADDRIDQRFALMEQKLDAVADKVGEVKADVWLMQATMATKSALAEARASILMWVVGSVFLAQLLPPLIKAFGP